MTQRAFVFAILIVAGAMPAIAADAPRRDFDFVPSAEYYDLHRDAAAAYGKKNYGEALEKFQRLACAGDKPSQAAVGEMYLTGKGVTRNDLTGYEWFKVASEFNFAPYRKVSKAIEGQLSPAQAQFTNERVIRMLSVYGLRATNMSCEVNSSMSYASNMKNNVQCTPDNINSGTQFLLHRCVDEAPPAPQS
jgi:TPR repeat protein